MRKQTLRPYQLAWLKENVKGKPFSDLAALFNSRFNTCYTRKQITNFCLGNGFKNGMPRVKGGHYWTGEELTFLKEHAKDNANKELTALINKALNLSLTRRQVHYATLYNKIQTKEQSPAKCTEEIEAFIRERPGVDVKSMTAMINNTFGAAFTTRQISSFRSYYKYRVFYKNTTHEAQLWSERVKRGGHVFVKVSMTGPQNQRWKEKHRWVWEQANGKIPPGMEFIFLDKNPQNCTLENLVLVSKAEKIYMVTNNLVFNDRESTLAGIAIARYSQAIHNRLKKTLGIEGHRKFVSRESAKRIQKIRRNET